MEFLADLHPLVIHFPIALLMVYSIFVLLSFWNSDRYFPAALIILFVGVLVGIVAVLSGNQAAELFRRENFLISPLIQNAIENHEFFATITLWFYILLLVSSFYLYIKHLLDNKKILLLLILSLIGCGLIYTTGSIGGELVYDHGVGVDLLIGK
ncbi:MAG: DUF2231 domain-containing protein [Melioribacteraceae bacterium]|nr:DUF2231 domain-containing protein [Melioribacteraceae bacterium]MCO6474547.1 DUF2231 domain-containing protein [Melioribacteraceae bacterium]MDD3557408.1 DUF2231 domain-containing protein [Melioribacteraceae bacterium]